MAIRTLCVVLVIVVHNPARWVFAVLAVILPYIAVVMANAAGTRRGSGAAPVTIERITLPGSAQSEKPHLVEGSSEQANPHSHERTA